MEKGKALKIAGMVTGALAGVSALILAALVWTPFWKHPFVGIIGGADGPTAIYVAAGEGWQALFGAVPAVLAAASAICFLIRKKLLTKGK